MQCRQGSGDLSTRLPNLGGVLQALANELLAELGEFVALYLQCPLQLLWGQIVQFLFGHVIGE